MMQVHGDDLQMHEKRHGNSLEAMQAPASSGMPTSAWTQAITLTCSHSSQTFLYHAQSMMLTHRRHPVEHHNLRIV